MVSRKLSLYTVAPLEDEKNIMVFMNNKCSFSQKVLDEICLRLEVFIDNIERICNKKK